MNYLKDDKASIDEILQQAPPHIDYDRAKVAYYNARRNVSQALSDLWALSPLPEKKRPVGQDAEKWEEIRNTCDEFDAAAAQALDAFRKNQAASTVQNIQSPIIRSHDAELSKQDQ